MPRCTEKVMNIVTRVNRTIAPTTALLYCYSKSYTAKATNGLLKIMALPFTSRRSPVVCRQGCVACSQPLAAEVGLQVLRRGGNAADAAVAVAAALNVTEPCSTGIGGDCFCLFYDANSREVQGINGSGRAPLKLSLEVLESQGFSTSNPLPPRHAHNVTVPGAAAGWVDTISKFGSGKLSLLEILQPAIDLAENGFPVAPVAAYHWEWGAADLLDPKNRHGKDMLLNNRAPRAGEIMKMPVLAKTFKTLGKQGKAGFYEGRIAKAIAECVQQHGGSMTVEDLKNHQSTFDTPIKTTYRGIDVWEMPPNGQGITALLALNILEGFDFTGIQHNSAEYLHLLIEAMQLSFADTWWYCADPNKVEVPVEGLLSKQYATTRRNLMSKDKCLPSYLKGEPFASSDTVYFSVVDSQGNACSFINSNYMGFGTALVPEGCGFTLQNRGANFSLDSKHPNCIAPSKRSYHTIIPGMATHSSSGELYACFGVMGGFMQPQGHVQVLLNMLEYKMDPQEALDAPRFSVLPPPSDVTVPGVDVKKRGVAIEEGISLETIMKLKEMGHNIEGPVLGHNRVLFGRGQIIISRPVSKNGRSRVDGKDTKEEQDQVWWAGSDPRGDGLAIGY